MTKDNNHAIENAVNWYQSISELIEGVNNEGGEYNDDTYNEIMESPLSIEVRCDWHTPDGDNKPTEYLILLTTGGPALRIIGDLDEHMTPCSAKLQWQDWGTPWTTIWSKDNVSIDEDMLLTYARYFWYGD
jgi:hypothetical protein